MILGGILKSIPVGFLKISFKEPQEVLMEESLKESFGESRVLRKKNNGDLREKSLKKSWGESMKECKEEYLQEF